MHEWEALQKLGHKEMKKLVIGTRVQLRFIKQVPPGKIIEVEPPYGLLAPRYKCQWDDGDKSRWLRGSDLIKI